MLLTDRLKNQKNMSNTDIIIANYILNNIENVINMNITTLAENTFCSTATISRFCKKIKMESFSNLKSHLTAENYSLHQNTKRIEYNYPFDSKSKTDEISEKIAQLSKQTIDDSFNSINLDKIVESARLLHEAQQISIYAAGNSLVTAIDLHNKLLWIGKNSNLEIMRGLQHLNAKTKKENSIAIVISYYGTNQDNINVIKALNLANVPYILITGPKLNPLCMHARVTLQVSPDEDYLNKIAPISSRIALTYITDVLFSVLYSYDYENYQSLQLAHQRNEQNIDI